MLSAERKKNIYFISDVHLSFEKNEVEKLKRKKLIDFLNYIKDDAAELYLIGDIFDFWFEWYHVIPKFWFPILFHLKKLIESGVIINFITGNHDFNPGDYLEKEIGIKCFKEQTDFMVDSKRFFVAHGDGYAKRDRGYRLLKRIIRNPLSIFLYKTLIPADIGVQLAIWTSNSSRKLKRIDKKSWGQEYYEFAKQKFNTGFDFVILGHIHYPMIREKNGKVYINCGDWISNFTYSKYDGKTLSLNWYKLKD